MSKISDAQAYLATFKATFTATTRLLVAGKADLVFTNLAKSVTADTAFTALKRRRTDEAVSIAQANNSGGDANTIAKQVGTLRVNFARTGLQSLQQVILDKSSTAVNLVAGFNSLAQETLTGVQSYISGAQNGGFNQTADNTFAGNAQSVINSIRRLLVTQEGRLKGENVYYSADLANAKKALSAAEAALTGLKTDSAAAAQAAANPPATDPAADDPSTVPVSTTPTLDVTA